MLKNINKNITLKTYHCKCKGDKVMTRIGMVWRNGHYIAKCLNCNRFVTVTQRTYRR